MQFRFAEKPIAALLSTWSNITLIICVTMSALTLGERLEKDFEYNNCVKDADIYIRMGKMS